MLHSFIYCNLAGCCASLAAGIVVLWRSNRRYVFFILLVCVCNIALPFLSGPAALFFLPFNLTSPLLFVIKLLV